MTHSHPKHNCSITFIYYYHFFLFLFFLVCDILSFPPSFFLLSSPPLFFSSGVVSGMLFCCIATLCPSSCFKKQNKPFLSPPPSFPLSWHPSLPPLCHVFSLFSDCLFSCHITHLLSSLSVPFTSIVLCSPLCPIHSPPRPPLPSLPLSVLSLQSLYPSDSRKCPSHSPTWHSAQRPEG